MGWAQTILIVALVALLAWAAVDDLRRRTIPNRLNLAIALLAPLWWWASAVPLWPEAALQVMAAAIVFGLFAAAFAFGAMGGGDVKMIGALALWLPLKVLLPMLMLMAVLGGVVTLATLAAHRIRRREGRPEVPYGVAIALAGLWTVANVILTVPGA